METTVETNRKQSGNTSGNKMETKRKQSGNTSGNKVETIVETSGNNSGNNIGNNSGYSVIWWYLGVPGGTLVVSGGSLRVPLGHPGLGAGGPTLRCRNHCNLQGLRSRYGVSPRRNAPEVQKVP